MFQFNSLQSFKARSYLNRLLASHGLYQDYFEPFNCECRVYGRLKAENREDLAVPAHGYLLLTPKHEAEVTERSALHELSSSDTKYTENIDLFGRLDEHAGLPVHAIVKELVTDRTPFTPAHLQQMWEDMEEMHRLGILIIDVKIFNYMGGKLVDFSRAMTVPHPSISTMHPEQLRRVRKSEPTQLWDCMVDWWMGNQWDWEEAELPSDMMDCASGEGPGDDGRGNYPRAYDWRVWEEDLETAYEFFAGLFAEDEVDDGAGTEKTGTEARS